MPNNKNHQTAGVWRADTGDNQLRLTAYRENIIRVQYGRPSDLDSSHEQTWLIVQPQLPSHPNPEAKCDSTVLDAGELRAHYDREQGRLWFERTGGELLLAETEPDARSLGVADTPGASPWAARQRFQLQDAESLYGMGQFPADSLRLNGRSLDLCQENPIIVVPMLVSNRGYGIFWNSGAHGAFNRVTGPVPSSCLADDNGEAGRLTMRRFANTGFEGSPDKQPTSTIDAEWRGARVEAWIDAGQDLEPLKPFSVRWSGKLIPKESGRYTFKTCFPDGCRLWIDDRPILDSRGVHSWVNIDAELEADRAYKLIVESVQPCDWRGAFARFWWSPPAATDHFALWSKTDPCIDYFVIGGKGPDDLTAGFRELTGRATMLPRWAFGLWQSKEHYRTTDELTGVVETYRSRNIPLDVIVQDWRYWDPMPWGTMRFDPQRYPDPAATFRDLHDRLHTKVLLSIWSDFHPDSDTHAQLSADGLLLPKGFRNETQFVDMYKPEGRDAYWRIVRERLAPTGVDAWWLDCTEPKFEHPLIADVLSRRLVGMDGESRNDRLNTYGLEASRAVYDGARKDIPDKRVTLLNRSGFAGSQRYGTIVWSGDIYADWQTLREQVVAGLSCCAAGVPYWNSDLGGFFSGDPQDPAYAELFVRWFQFGCFCPVTRIHGTHYAKEPWRFDARYAVIIESFTRLRYELLPYIYALAGGVWLRHGTMMRSLGLDYPQDTRACAISDQYLFGPSLMVCPVLEPGAETRCVYLPEGHDWYDYWTGERITGGATLQAEAPLHRMPIYLPAGAILPTGPVVQHTGELTSQPLRIQCMPGRDGTFPLYEDAGDGYGYEQGEYSVINMRWTDQNRTVTLDARKDVFPGMPIKRDFILSCPKGTESRVTYTGDMIEAAL